MPKPSTKTTRVKRNSLYLQGVKENNLKNFSIEIEHDSLVCITGLSGSGKSSLAFSTVFAEGQRRYIETFSPYTRQFLDKIKKPELDHALNIRPAIAIQQKTKILNSRSTVGSLTNLNDYLRTLWTHIAKPICPECGTLLESFTAAELTKKCKQLCEQLPEETFLICSSIAIPTSKAKKKVLFEHFAAVGYSRFLDPKTLAPILVEADDSPPLWAKSEAVIVVDRVKNDRFSAKSVLDSITQAYSLSQGRCALLPGQILASAKKAFSLQKYRYFQQLRCPDHPESIVPRIRKSLFSYNHPNGACDSCNGFGFNLTVDPTLVVPNPGLSLNEKAIHPWSSENRAWEHEKLIAFARKKKIPVSIAWHSLSEEQQRLLFDTKEKGYTGITHWFKRLERKSYRMHVRVFLAKYRSQKICAACQGSRLKTVALLYQYNELSLPELWEMEIDKLHAWLVAAEADLLKKHSLSKPLKDIFESTMTRLRFLTDLGLPYLTLTRQARTLSGGETQRVNLAAALGSNLASTQFVLDEPSVGLHARDTERLIEAVKRLTAKNSSVLVVEHDPEFIRAADRVIEIGPFAGSGGGEIIYNGPYENWANRKNLSLNRTNVPARIVKSKSIKIRKAAARNLKKINCSIPIGSLTVLSGVSGSGKSTLVSEVILAAYKCHAQGVPADLVPGTVTGFEHIDDCVFIDQSTLAKSPRANVATYTKIWDEIRNLLAATEQAQQRALTKSAFSFNVDKGRCPACNGAGHTREDMQFLSDMYLPCETCLGKRFQDSILEISFKRKNAFEWLKTTVADVAKLLPEHTKISATCDLLLQLGLGHLTLGHSLSELSGGEAQRLKLIKFVDATSAKPSLLIFDEPTTGLHPQDVGLFLDLLDALKERGHSLICVEHNLDVIQAADHIIDLGPEGGAAGGSILVEGTVAELKKSKTSYTAKFLNKKSPGRKARRLRKTVPPQAIQIEGARQHNLKDVSLSIPLGKTIAFTGVSGSGKSSIARDILFAEGQRRYLDCLSPYARQFIKGLDKPVVDSLENIPPGVYVGQHLTLPVQISTVATLSEIYNFLRLLFVKVGTQYCPDHPQERIANLSAQVIADELRAEFNSRIKLLAPIVTGRKGNHKELIRRALDAEISEIRVDGHFCKASSVLEGLERNKTHTIEYVIATCTPMRLDRELLQEAIDHALTLGAGSVIVVSEKDEWIYSSSRSCPKCKRGFLKPDPEDLSFHSRRGSCVQCDGTGLDKKGGSCKQCNGQRLNAIGRNIRINGKNVSELVKQRPSEALDFLKKVQASINNSATDAILAEVLVKLKTLSAIGLDHLELDRDCKTLSSGELQRVRLTAALGSSLSGVLYLLDEPSAGLHPFDNRLVLDKIDTLKENGSSVIIIEHDPETILHAEHIIELGPGGGREGGRVVFTGSREQFMAEDTKTARAVRKSTDLTVKDLPRKSTELLTIESGTFNTVSVKDLAIPLQSLVTICGVSGAGKSSLVEGLIVEAIFDGDSEVESNAGTHWSGPYSRLFTNSDLQKLLVIDQQPIGKNTRSTPASYLGLWDHLRKLFALTPEAKSLGWTASFFSYNTGKGRCPACEGRGRLKLEMNFLADSAITCDACEGKRFSDEANTVRFTGLSPADTLSLTFEEAKHHFANYPKIRKPVDRACALGLGYLTLGQSSTTLSGGEAQRLKLVAELSTRQSDHTLYILDEPTTGLHVDDVSRLMKVLNELIDLGNSILVIEHDPFVIAQADYIIELGPGPGPAGGRIIFTGPPAQLLNSNTPWGQIFKQQFASVVNQ